MSPITEKMAARPPSAVLRSFNKNHVTTWINKIKDYRNDSVDLNIKNPLLVTEETLRRHYNEYVKLSSGVIKYLKSANVTQEDFDREKDHQAKMEEEFREALVIVKTKTGQYDKQQEEKSTAALIEQDRLLAAARKQDRLAAEALREQDRREHQQKMQQGRDLIQKLINNLKAGLPVSALAAAENAAQNRKLPESSEITHGSAEKLIEKSDVSNNLNIHSVNQSFSLPERPATTLDQHRTKIKSSQPGKRLYQTLMTPHSQTR